MISIDCQSCFKEYGEFKKKDVPKSFVCPQCKIGQTVCVPSVVGFARGRDYPEGYYPNKMMF